GTTVTIDGKPCADIEIASATKIECVTPPGTPGAKDIVVDPLDADPIQVRDGFTYSDSVDGYRGGLSGGAFAGRLKVLAFDSFLGKPIPGAFAIAGDVNPKIARTQGNGVVEIDDLDGDKVTVTVAAKCFSPITFVDVPVDTVTVYLDPILDPACLSGDPGSPPGRQIFGGYIDGHLMFPGGNAVQRPRVDPGPCPPTPT